MGVVSTSTYFDVEASLLLILKSLCQYVFITLLHSSQETHTVVIQDYFDDKTHGLFLV